MPYTKEHKQKSRERILDSASQLFSRRGYDAVSIDDLMSDAGLTRGAFYNHFEDKADVYAEAILHAAANSPFAQHIDRTNPSLHALEEMLDLYLSRGHLEQLEKTEPPCPLAFLVTDVGIREGKVRSAYTRVHRALANLIGNSVTEDARKAKQLGLAVTALMIGGVAVGRALDSSDAAEALLNSCRDAAKQLLRGQAQA